MASQRVQVLEMTTNCAERGHISMLSIEAEQRPIINQIVDGDLLNPQHEARLAVRRDYCATGYRLELRDETWTQVRVPCQK